MPPNNSDPAFPSVDTELLDRKCPKCGTEMEPIESSVEGLPLQQLQLCPGCYLVMWSDPEGLHVRQGMPVREGVDPRSEPIPLDGEPTKC